MILAIFMATFIAIIKRNGGAGGGGGGGSSSGGGNGNVGDHLISFPPSGADNTFSFGGKKTTQRDTDPLHEDLNGGRLLGP